ncbi:CAP domain-containing protein [Dactylosporangium matsuzakiense]|uniref:SCP domain-containing protein n=1 Tax=Dactylosporangium matsuzakiense TaxID=53360 RepID=A0A9W6KIJ2_9ACTN|nr:CAP domain-containing protein [Dactylosporangium matsuzakiense]GLL01848.1 hypothetical protein GCM10017581_035900 [Dactylosporangium matsuzakiense]
MTRFARRATTIAAALIAAPLGFALVTTTGPQAFAAGAPVTASVAHVAEAVGASAADDAAAKASYTAKKKKKKKSLAKKKPVTTPTTTPTTAPVTTSPSTVETEVVTLTNNFRTANGCGALRIDTRLVTAARDHSADMVTKNFFDHTGSNGSNFVQREEAAGYTKGGASAENIAWGYRTAQDVVNGWINSPGHRANMLNCQSVAVGVGLAYKADGTPYWTQDFGRV